MHDGEIVYSVKVDSKGGEAEARKAGERMGQEMNDSGSGHASTWKEIWIGAARKIGEELVKLGAQAAQALGNAVIDITKSAVEGFAQYEQLVGGVDTLFKESSDKVQEYAANAYKTAGLSANEYMDTVTSFSASLLQSLGGDTAAAADMADQAITDMADNANKMGTDMRSIQNAYQGFAKKNYTMLDNLKLGYGGTEDEMNRLIADANELRIAQGKAGDLTINKFSDVVEAIHEVQTEMGITGTTAAEASSTIQGSVDSMKSAWSNLVTGLADENANMDELVGNFVDSVETAAENLLPVIGTAIDGALELISDLIPMIVEYISENADQIANEGIELVMSLINGIFEAFPQLLIAWWDILAALLANIGDHLPEFIEMAIKMVLSLVEGALKAAPKLLAAFVEMIADIISAFFKPDWKGIGKNILDGIWNGIKDGWNWLVNKVKEVAHSLFDAACQALHINSPSKDFIKVGESVNEGTEKGMESGKEDLQRTVTTMYQDLHETAVEAISPHDFERAFSHSLTPTLSLGDIERSFSENVKVFGKTPDITINIPVNLDGREIARVTAWNMGEQLAWEEM